MAGLVAPLTEPYAPEVAAGSKIALARATIVIAAMAAHQAALGVPMDLSKLHQIAPVA